MKRLKMFGFASLLLSYCFSTPLISQTVLWDFNTPGGLPDGWTNSWNGVGSTCDQTPGNQGCDYQQRPWGVNSSGRLSPPEYINNNSGSEGMDSYAETPLFKASSATVSSSKDGFAHDESEDGSPLLTFFLYYNSSFLEQSGTDIDAIQALLFTEGSSSPESLVDLAFYSAQEWENLDNADGVNDDRIKIEHEIVPETQYRLRVRAYDFDLQLGTLGGIGFDDIAVTNGVIIGDNPTLPGDFDGDGDIDGRDFLVWQRGQSPIPLSGNDLAQWQASFPNQPGDFDEDGDIDGRDFLVWQRNPGVGNLTDWQTNYVAVPPTATASAAVPEPGIGMMMVLLGIGGWGRRGWAITTRSVSVRWGSVARR